MSNDFYIWLGIGCAGVLGAAFGTFMTCHDEQKPNPTRGDLIAGIVGGAFFGWAFLIFATLFIPIAIKEWLQEKYPHRFGPKPPKPQDPNSWLNKPVAICKRKSAP